MDSNAKGAGLRQGAACDAGGRGATYGGARGALVTTAKFAARIKEVVDEKTGETWPKPCACRRLLVINGVLSFANLIRPGWPNSSRSMTWSVPVQAI